VSGKLMYAAAEYALNKRYRDLRKDRSDVKDDAKQNDHGLEVRGPMIIPR
jgi:hypothetical protein